jgi:hypothetical protein
MRHNAEAQTGAVWCRTDDDRVTPIGKLLRATHIDEFPQLLNVLRGEMSLVGPRPERPEFVRSFEEEIERYAYRHLVRPGITGVAQLRLPADSDLNSVLDKLEFDLFYVRHLNPWLDAKILCGTVMRFAVGLICGLTPAWLALPTQEAVQADWRNRFDEPSPSDSSLAVVRLDATKISRVEQPSIVETVTGRSMMPAR